MQRKDGVNRLSTPATKKRRGVNMSDIHSLPTSTRSVRSVRQKATLKKSQYFERSGSSSSSSDGNEQSGYEDEPSAASAGPSVGDEDEEYVSDVPKPPRKKIKGRDQANSMQKQGANELWRPGTKTGLGPGTQVIIDKPKPRGPGKIPYRDSQIHPNTFLFLEELVQNNDREWLKMHDPDYRTSWNDFMTFLEPLQQRLLEADETIPELPLKDVIFRIYRDVRFSSDPTPYKCHYSAAFSRTGRKGPFAAYYMQIKPKGSFVGGGLWMPEAAALAKLRRNINRKPHKIKQVLSTEDIRRHFLGGIPADEKRVVKSFAAQNAGNALKTKPKGFDADHQDIELLKLKNFTIGTKLKDEEVLGPRGLDCIAKLFEALVPFITYLNDVVMPDEQSSSSESDQTSSEAGE